MTSVMSDCGMLAFTELVSERVPTKMDTTLIMILCLGWCSVAFLKGDYTTEKNFWQPREQIIEEAMGAGVTWMLACPVCAWMAASAFDLPGRMHAGGLAFLEADGTLTPEHEVVFYLCVTMSAWRGIWYWVQFWYGR